MTCPLFIKHESWKVMEGKRRKGIKKGRKNKRIKGER